MFIIDFGTNTTEAEAALYEMPFEYVKHHVKPERTLTNLYKQRPAWLSNAHPPHPTPMPRKGTASAVPETTGSKTLPLCRRPE